MKRAVKIAAALLLVLSLFAGCTNKGNPLPEGMEEKAVISAGREVALSVINGDYDSVYDRLRADQKELTSVDAIRTLAIRELGNAGVYREISDTMATGQKAEGEEIGVAVFWCTYSEKKILMQFAFDPNMELVGLSISRK